MRRRMDTTELSPDFFLENTVEVARRLLGKYLVRRAGRRTIAGMITEVEAYDGLRDRGSHASRGKTARNAPMFGSPGHWYIYCTYGMHWMLNIVTREAGYPAAILIRGVATDAEQRGKRRIGSMLRKSDIHRKSDFPSIEIRGPARVTKYFRIGKQFNNKQATRATGLWIEERPARRTARPPAAMRRLRAGSDARPHDSRSVSGAAGGGVRISRERIVSSPRVGIAYAGPYWSRRRWRFRLKEKGEKKE